MLQFNIKTAKQNNLGHNSWHTERKPFSQIYYKNNWKKFQFYVICDHFKGYFMWALVFLFLYFFKRLKKMHRCCNGQGHDMGHFRCYHSDH